MIDSEFFLKELCVIQGCFGHSSTQVISNIKRSIRHGRSRSLSTSKRLNQTDQQTLSIRSEYDVGKNGDQCYKSLIVPTEGKDEMELKEKSTNGSLLHNGPHGET